MCLLLKLLTLIVLQAAGLLCSVLVANIVQIGLWGKFVAEVSLLIILFMYQHTQSPLIYFTKYVPNKI